MPVQAGHSIDCLVMLRQGQVDAVSTDENILRGFLKMADDVALVTELSPDKGHCTYHQPAVVGEQCTWIAYEPHAFAFHRENIDLARFVNHALEKCKGKTTAGQNPCESTWEKAYEDWLNGHPNPTKPKPEPVCSREVADAAKDAEAFKAACRWPPSPAK